MPGPRVRRQLRGLLLPGHHRSGSGARQQPVRTLHQQGTQRAARHRRGLRAPAPRRSHPVHLPQVRPRTRRAHRRGHFLPAAQRAARYRLRAGRGRRRHRRRGARPPMVGRQEGNAAHPGRLRPGPGIAGGAPVGGAGADPDGLSAPPVAAPRRLRDFTRQAVAPGAHRKRRHGRPQRRAMGQGRPGCAGPAESGRAGAGHAVGPAPHAGAGWPAPRPTLAAAGHTRQRHAHLRHDLRRRHHRRVPDRIPRPDDHVAAAASARILRPGGAGGHRAPRPDPGRHGPSLPAPPPGQGARNLSQRKSARRAQPHHGRAHLPGTGHADRRGGRRLHAGRIRPVAPLHGGLEAQGRRGQVPQQTGRRPAGPWLQTGFRRGAVPADRRLRRIRLPRKPRRQLRPAGLCQFLAQAARARSLPGRPAQLPAHGLLRPRATGAGRPPPRRLRAAGGRHGQRLGLGPGDPARRSSWRPPAPPSARARRRRHPSRRQAGTEPDPGHARRRRPAHRRRARCRPFYRHRRPGPPRRARPP
ncbi:hypothetical protein LMG3410_06454 [Achromobacter aegrifaciens]|nr:hypothetical protein LMG3410_06454 [Achromobacter aegrifaciens]